MDKSSYNKKLITRLVIVFIGGILLIIFVAIPLTNSVSSGVITAYNISKEYSVTLDETYDMKKYIQENADNIYSYFVNSKGELNIITNDILSDKAIMNNFPDEFKENKDNLDRIKASINDGEVEKIYIKSNRIGLLITNYKLVVDYKEGEK